MGQSVTKSIQIDRPSCEVFAFVADPSNTPRWAIHRVRSIRSVDGRVWLIDTPHGTVKFVSHFHGEFGILDHEFVDPQDRHWVIPARVVSSGRCASVFMITLTRPDAVAENLFDVAVLSMDEELRTLKACVEMAVSAT
jgi:hypothetical protein